VDEDFGAKPQCLLPRTFGKVGATDAFGEAEIVLDLGLVPAWPPTAKRSTKTVFKPSDAP
jgi:hypothetical protein